MWYGLGIAILFVCFALWLTNLTIHAVIRKFKRSFGFNALGDYASLPLIMIFISVISFVFQPITNGFSRYDEHQADMFGMDITGVSGEVAATAFDKLAVLNLSDPNPSPLIEFWFYDHPALNKRMEFVRNYQPKPFNPN
jgi:Zn-dependent protease with chaperone function